MEGVNGKVVLICVKDRGCYGEGLFEATLREEKFRFGK